LTFIAPIVAYYDFIGHFDSEQIDEDRQNQIVWQARLIALVVTVGLWVVMFLPIAIWKYMVILIWFLYHFSVLKRVLEKGRVRVNKMIDRWAKDDVRSASSYAAIPTWKVTMPGMFRDGIVGLNSHLQADSSCSTLLGSFRSWLSASLRHLAALNLRIYLR
jgi:fatty acid desaturase